MSGLALLLPAWLGGLARAILDARMSLDLTFKTIGPYSVMGRVGEGANGAVYVARHEHLRRDVALKVMLSEHGQQQIDRFRREAEAASRVNHPAVVRIYDYGEEDGHVYLAMEFVTGRNLQHFLRESGALAPERALALVKQICEGLSACHDAGLVHRDIKPANLMVDGEGNARILDLGLVRVIDRTALTESGGLVGTPAYLPPEVLVKGDPDARSDIYQVGLVLYECLAGRRPFESGAIPEVIGRIARGEVPPLEGFAPEVEDFYRKCTALNPENRFSSCHEAAAHPALGGTGMKRRTRKTAGRTPVTPPRSGGDGGGMRGPVLAMSLAVGIALGIWGFTRETGGGAAPPSPKRDGAPVHDAKRTPEPAEVERAAARCTVLCERLVKRVEVGAELIPDWVLGGTASAATRERIKAAVVESQADLGELRALQEQLDPSHVPLRDLPDPMLEVLTRAAGLEMCVWAHAEKLRPFGGAEEVNETAFDVGLTHERRSLLLPVVGVTTFRRAVSLIVECLSRPSSPAQDRLLLVALHASGRVASSFWGADLDGAARAFYEREREQLRGALERLPGGTGTEAGRAVYAVLAMRWPARPSDAGAREAPRLWARQHHAAIESLARLRPDAAAELRIVRDLQIGTPAVSGASRCTY